MSSSSAPAPAAASAEAASDVAAASSHAPAEALLAAASSSLPDAVDAAGAPAAAAPGPASMMRVAPGPKSSTTSTLFLSSTLSVPNNDEISLGVATVLHCQLMQDYESGRACPEPYKPAAALFHEDTYAVPGASAGTPVTPIEEIYTFIKRAFDLAQFSPECNILALIFINRLMAFTKIPLTAKTWRLALISAMLVAQKVWDDRALANVDFPTVFATAAGLPSRGHVDVKVINQLERKFLELLGYNVSVSSSLYAKYYFELRTLAEENHLQWRLEPLTVEQARALEATSTRKRDEFRAGKGVTEAVARAHTVADISSAGAPSAAAGKGRAVLS